MVKIIVESLKKLNRSFDDYFESSESPACSTIPFHKNVRRPMHYNILGIKYIAFARLRTNILLNGCRATLKGKSWHGTWIDLRTDGTYISKLKRIRFRYLASET